MNILVTGGTGFIGSALVARLKTEGYHVTLLSRRPAASRAEIHWDPDNETLDEIALEGFEAVFHLAGESIASGRWTAAKKNRIRESRVRGTRLLCEALARQPKPPQVLISASAIGYYGDRGDDVLNESSSKGTDFLAEVCSEWEAATRPVQEKGIRVAFPRTGIVLGKNGGALKQMLPPFRLGIGGRLGSGHQFMSWVSLEDEVRALIFALKTESLSGPFNVTAPNAVTNEEFTEALGHVLHRPTILPAPAFALRLALGEMAEALLLSSARVRPEKLLRVGYVFRHSSVEEGLRAALE